MTAAHGRPWQFFALTALLSVPFLILGALVDASAGLVGGLPLSALQFIAPLLAAVLLTWRHRGRRDVGRLLLRAVDLRRLHRMGHLLPLVLVMPVIYATSYVVMLVEGRPMPAWEVSLPAVAVLLVLFLITGLAEEVGWTGYALDPLRARLGLVGAALVIGVVCALFHVGADLQAGRDLDWILWQRLASIALRVLIVIAYAASGHVLAAAVIVHAMDNVSWTMFPVGGSHHDPSVTAPVSILVAVIALLVTRERLRRGGDRRDGRAPSHAPSRPNGPVGRRFARRDRGMRISSES